MKKKALSILLALCFITMTAFATVTPDIYTFDYLEDGEYLAATPGTTDTPDQDEDGGEIELFATPGTTGEALAITPFALNVDNPYFTYTGQYDYVEYAAGKYYIALLTSGTFTPKKNLTADVFIVGGGQAGYSSAGGSGGAGGYTNTVRNISLTAGSNTAVTIGAGGSLVSGSGAAGEASAFGAYTANGGASTGGGSGGGQGGQSSSGNNLYPGSGGSNGSNGYARNGYDNTLLSYGGQGTTTYAFGGDKAPFNTMLFAGGGGGGGHGYYNAGGSNTSSDGGYGGAGGGGAGGNGATSTNSTPIPTNGQAGTANTGGGGGGAGGGKNSSSTFSANGGNGGSGIVIVRLENVPPTTPPSWAAQPSSSVNSWSSTTLTWTCNASTDPDGDTIYYVFDALIGGEWTTVQNSTSRTYTHTINIPGDSYMQVRVRSNDSKEYSDGYLTSSLVSITHDTVKPTIQIAASPDVSAWAKDEVTITVIVADAESGLASLTVPSGVTPAGNQTLSGQSSTKTFKATANGIYAFTVTDNAGNSAAASITISKIDRDDPVISYTTAPPAGGFTNGNVTINLTISDATSGLASFNSLNGSENVSGNITTKMFTATSNGVYPFSVTDIVGHSAAINVNIDMIDRVKPVTSIVPRVRQWTNAASVIFDITATDDYSGIASITRPDGSTFTGAATTYEIFNNGSYTASSTDRASNVSDPAMENYAWFDRTKPTIQFVKFTSTDNPVTSFFANLFGIVSNKYVKIEVTAADTPDPGDGESGVTHMFFRVFNQAGELVQDWTSSPIGTAPTIDYDVNGYVEVYVKDAATNESASEVYDILVDTKPPEVEVIYSTTEITYDPVEVTLRIVSDDGSPAKGWVLPEGGVMVSQAEITYTFTENAVKAFKAYDTAGNERKIDVEVSNIEDRKVPVELWENNQPVIDAILHATGRRDIYYVTYTDLLKIKFIDLSSNGLKSIPDVFGECANLEHLDLRGNEFDEIPECVYELTKLKHLDLSNNDLMDIGDSIRNLTQIETLDVSLNYLVDYDCPMVVDDYRNVGNFTRSGQANQYSFRAADTQKVDEVIGNTVQINVDWFYDGQPIDRLEDHRKTLYMGMYPRYRTYRPLLFNYEVQNGQIKAATPDYVQVFLNNTGVVSASLRLGEGGAA